MWRRVFPNSCRISPRIRGPSASVRGPRIVADRDCRAPAGHYRLHCLPRICKFKSHVSSVHFALPAEPDLLCMYFSAPKDGINFFLCQYLGFVITLANLLLDIRYIGPQMVF